MADRFTYVPLVGLFLVLAMGAAELPRRLVPRTVLASAAVLLVLACVLRTRNQLQYWRNGEMLARHAIAVTITWPTTFWEDAYTARNASMKPLPASAQPSRSNPVLPALKTIWDWPWHTKESFKKPCAITAWRWSTLQPTRRP